MSIFEFKNLKISEWYICSLHFRKIQDNFWVKIKLQMNKFEDKFNNPTYKSQILNLIPKHLNQNTQQIFQISTIILSSLTGILSLWNFVCKLLLHTPFGYVSNLSYILGDTQCFLRHKRKTVSETRPYTERDKFLEYLSNKGDATCWQWEVPHEKHFRWHIRIQSPSTKTCKLITVRQLCCTSIPWHSHFKSQPTSDKRAVTFPSLCILGTHHSNNYIVFQCT